MEEPESVEDAGSLEDANAPEGDRTEPDAETGLSLPNP